MQYQLRSTLFGVRNFQRSKLNRAEGVLEELLPRPHSPQKLPNRHRRQASDHAAKVTRQAEAE
jgi:hypothetical protein